MNMSTEKTTQTDIAPVQTDSLHLMIDKPQPKAPRVWPCLIGATGSGKTSRVKHLAHTMGLPLHTVLLHSALPEDLFGIPRNSGKRLSYSLPNWLADAIANPTLIFLDELDKAGAECLASALTLLSELEVHGTPLHPETRIIAATQPVGADWASTELRRAIVGRLCFLPHSGVIYTAQKLGMRLSWLAESKTTAPLLPQPTLRQLDWLVPRLHRARGTYRNDLVDGIIHPAMREVFLADLASRKISPEDLRDLINEDPSLVDSLSVPECISIAHLGFTLGSFALLLKIVERVWTLGNYQERTAYAERHYQGFKTLIGDRESIEIWPEITDDQAIDLLDHTIGNIHRDWSAKIEAEKGGDA